MEFNPENFELGDFKLRLFEPDFKSYDVNNDIDVFETLKYYDLYIPVSTPEKILIDFIYFKEPLTKETMKELKKHINKKTLDSYLKKEKLPSALKQKVLSKLTE